VSDVIVEADYLLTCNLTNAVIKDGAVYVVGDRIKAIGSRKDIHKDFSANVVIEGLNKILVPGLVNTHSHSVQTLLRGKADDLALIDWLQKVILPGEISFTVDEVYTSSLLGFAEMIRTGTTTCNDMLTTNHSDYGIQAAIDSGIRTRIGRMLMDVNNGFPDDMIEHTEKIVEDVIKDIGDYHQTQKNRIKYSLNARFLLSCSPQLMKKLSEIQRNYPDIMIHTHASENREECAQVERYYGKSYIRALNELDVLGNQTIIAHGIWLDDVEYSLIEQTDTRITHNPSSNSKLASGICDVSKYLDMDVIVGLGTDGAPCNNNLDMFREMRLASFLQKIKHLDERVLPSKVVLKMATIEGAKALNLDKEIGSLEIGKKADLFQVDISDVNCIPLYDPISHLVYSASGKDVNMVMIDGKILFKDNQFTIIDLQNLREKATLYQNRWNE